LSPRRTARFLRLSGWVIPAALLVVLGGCQLISGLSAYHEGTGGASSSTVATGVGGATSSAATSSVATSSAATSSVATSTASTSSSGGCPASLTDPKNCCTPGHDCTSAGATGACHDGVCQVYVAVTAAQGDALADTNVVSDGSYAYWATNSNGILRTFVTENPGNAGVVVDAAHAHAQTGVAVGSGLIYWDDQSGDLRDAPVDPALMQVPAAFNASGQTGVGSPSPILVSTTTVAWSVPSTLLYYQATTTNVATSAASPLGARLFALDDDDVYWYETSGMARAALDTDAGVMKSILMPPQGVVQAMFVDPGPRTAGFLYWASGTQILRFSKTAGLPAVPLTASTGEVGSIVADARWVYWTAGAPCADGAHIRAFPLEGPGGVAIDLGAIGHCAVLGQDQHALYLADGGAILRVVKPL
jgi:hypothetical protein